MRRPGAAKKGGTPAARSRAADPRSEPPPPVAGVHRWRSDARRRAVDQPVAARVVATAVGAGDPRHRRTIRRLLSKLKRVTARHGRKRRWATIPTATRNLKTSRACGTSTRGGRCGDPIDTKKKELWEIFTVQGTTFTAETVETFDHDFGSAGQGKLIPHGIYDMVNQHAHIHLNASHDTSALCGDSVALWWEQAGRSGAIPRRNGCWCLETVAAATARRSTCSRQTCKGWRIGWGWRFVWPTLRRTVPSTIRSNTACSRLSRAPARG